jgi:AcrR family transcriptional regulator
MPKIVEEAKEKIVTSAKTQLFKHGYAEMTLRSVANSCGIAVGTIYNYFPSKEALVGSIMAEDWKCSHAEMEKKYDGAESLQQGIRAIYDELKLFSDLYAPVWADYMQSGNSLEHYGDRHLMLRHQIEEMLSQMFTRFGQQAEKDLIPLLSELIISAAVQKDIEYRQLQKIINRICI